MTGNNEQVVDSRRHYDARLMAWRIENRRRQGLPPLWTTPAPCPAIPLAPSATVPTRPALPPPTALDLEFEKTRSAALARLAAEREAQRAEDAAVALILGAS